MLANLERSTQVVQNGLCQFGRFIGLTNAGLYQCKLVAAQARETAKPTAIGAQAVSDGDQQTVAGLITKLFVNFFEVIQTATQHRYTALTSPGIGEDTTELLLQHAAVG